MVVIFEALAPPLACGVPVARNAGHAAKPAQSAGMLRDDVGSVDIHQLIELFSRRRPDDNSAAHQRLLAIALDGLRYQPLGTSR